MDVLWSRSSVICTVYERGKEVMREWSLDEIITWQLIHKEQMEKRFLFVIFWAHKEQMDSWVLVSYAATQLATPLHQRRIQVVRSKKVARKRRDGGRI